MTSAFTLRKLDEQGFGGLGHAAESGYAWPLRFAPAFCITLIAVGLALQAPVLLAFVALLGLCGALFPTGMPVDLLYNFGVRHLFRAPPLPPTPKPRRFSYLISAVSLTGSAVCFATGHPVVGTVLGGAVFIAGAVLTTALWCFGSFLYRRIFGPLSTNG